MLKLLAGAGLAILAAYSSAAAAIGPHAAKCGNGTPSVIARVNGLKARTGVVRVQLYANNKSTFLEKRRWIQRVDVAATRSGVMDICVPVPRAGSYALSVRHDLNANGKSDRADGGGFSGNPKVSITDLAFKKKPDLARVAFSVGAGPRVVPVTLNYVRGLSFKPVAGA